MKDLNLETVNAFDLVNQLEQVQVIDDEWVLCPALHLVLLLPHPSQSLLASKCHACPRKPASYALSARRHQVLDEMQSIQFKMSNESLSLFPDFKQVCLSPACSVVHRPCVTLSFSQRLAVLRMLGYTNAEDAIALKGRVAAEINTTEELVLTELLFEGVLGPLTPAEAVAVLSALVFQVLVPDLCVCKRLCMCAARVRSSPCFPVQGKSDDEPSLPPALKVAKEKSIAIALQLGRHQRDCGLAVDPHDYASSVLKFGLMEVRVLTARVPCPDLHACVHLRLCTSGLVGCLSRISAS